MVLRAQPAPLVMWVQPVREEAQRAQPAIPARKEIQELQVPPALPAHKEMLALPALLVI